MKKLLIKDKKYRLNIKVAEVWFFILKHITQNFNLFVLIWLNAFLLLNWAKQKKSKTFLITKCLQTINKKRFNKLTVLSRQVFLKKIRFGSIIGIQKINWFFCLLLKCFESQYFLKLLEQIQNSILYEMFFYLNRNLNQKSNKLKNELLKVVFFKDQLKYLKTAHAFHLINPSPWPLVAALSGFMLTTGLVSYMHKFGGGFSLLFTGFCLLLYVFYNWWRDVVRESVFENQHYVSVQKGLKLSMILFIVSEIMFFFAFFWGFFHVSVAPAYNIGGIWPPCSLNTINTFTVPLTNTFILLSSGITVTWAHHSVLAQAKKHTLIAFIFTLILALLFTSLQSLEYINSPFNISDGVYGSVFYLATGFHGFHVIVGTLALFVSFLRNVFNHFTNKHHLGFEFAIWYWHFVDVVWLFLFITVYWWSSLNI